MKKGVWLSILAVLLSGVIVYSMWYIYRRGELQNNSKDSFIPYNSALVVQINAGVSLPEKVGLAFQSNIPDFQKILLYQVASLLEKKGFYCSDFPGSCPAQGREREDCIFVCRR